MFFKEWLLLEEGGSNLQRYNKGGMVNLYHYSKGLSGPVEVLDPSKFGSNSYSHAERRALSTPRIFFYVDLRDKENFFDHNTFVHKAHLFPLTKFTTLKQTHSKAPKKRALRYWLYCQTWHLEGRSAWVILSCRQYASGDVKFKKIKVQRFAEEEGLRNDFGVTWADIKKEKEDAQTRRHQEEEVKRRQEEEEWKKQQAERDIWWQQELC